MLAIVFSLFSMAFTLVAFLVPAVGNSALIIAAILVASAGVITEISKLRKAITGEDGE